MAQPTNTYDTYDQVGIREDLSDMIYDVSPDETPFYSACAKVKAKSTLHEWQTDALRSSAVNAHIEGDDTTATARTATTRLTNITQIFKDAVVIPDTDEGIDKAGRKSEMALQVMKIAKEQKLDIEKALFANTAKLTGDSTTARLLAGLPTWLATNTTFATGGTPSGADPTGDGSDVRVDDSVPVAFSQARFDTTMQSIWESGGRPNDVYLSAFQMNLALGFTGMNNQRSTVTSTKEKTYVVNNFDLYVTPWGSVNFVLSREHRPQDVFIIENDKFAVAVLRPTKNTPLAKTGDNTKRQVITELTLVSRNEKASGAVYDNTTS